MNFYMIAGSILFLVLTLTYAVLSHLKGGRLGRMLTGTMVGCALMIGFFIAFLMTDNLDSKAAYYAYEIATSDWTLFCLLCFVCEYIARPVKKTEAAVIASFFLIDSAIFITNPHNHYAADFTPHMFKDIQYLEIEPKLFGYVHYAIIFAVCAFMLVIVIRKIVLTPKFYRGRYYLILCILLFMILGEVYFVIDETHTFDYTKYFIALVGAALYHSSYTFAPRRLLKGLQEYVNDKISDATIIYDCFGSVLNINKQAKALLDKKVWESGDLLLAFLGFPDSEGNFRKRIGDKLFDVFYKPVYDDKENLLAKTFIFYDITELEKQIEREHRIAITDALTGAYNRTGFFEAANDFLYMNESEAGFALVISGIVGFKAINSSYGAKVGDAVLKFIERCFHDYHHSYPMIYGRTAEGKFSVLVPFDFVDEIASDMTCIDVPIDNEVSIHVDMCHGFIVLDDIAKPLDYYYERALLALAECKKNTTAGAVEYSYDMEEQIQRRQLIVAEMHDALRDNQFFIELQPQIDLEERTVSGAEALVRWQHPKLGRISPGEFIPIFEENGFIINLDVYVWEHAAKAARMLADEGIYTGPVSINVSQIDITHMDVATQLERIAAQVDIDPSRIHVEITESACAKNPELLVHTMENLRKKGFLLEIDDFGSGYSSLNALMHLPFDVIKLDMQFMRESNLDGKNGIIINSMAEMIHALNAKIIVEGVETEANVENTVRFGGDIVQGYYFSRPLSIEAFKDFVKAHKH